MKIGKELTFGYFIILQVHDEHIEYIELLLR